MPDRTLTMTMLLDFYGELLTEKQRECFDLYHNEDMSLSEIAEQTGVSRQGVRDLLVRTEASLMGFEEKMGLVSKHLRRRQILAGMASSLDRLAELTDGEAALIAAELKRRLTDLEN